MIMEDILIQHLTQDEIMTRGIKSWPVWEKEVSRFPWTYDSTEECLILEGNIVVEAGEKSFHLNPGDFVTFRKGLRCTWDIKKPVRKHYNFR